MIENTKPVEFCTDQCPEIMDLKMLTGCIMHDINNILMAIQGNISLACKDYQKNQPISQRLENIQTCIQNATELSNEILSFIRHEKSPKVMANLNVIVKKIIRVYRRIFRGISFEPEFAPDIFRASVNRSQIERMVLNLFINAWKAMPSGGTIQVRTENVFFTENLKILQAKGYDRFVKLTVADTGVGMDAETQQRIFDPFFSSRLDQSGEGLGMTSVKRIIEAHDGFIRVRSQQGMGTKFEIYIPVFERS